MAFVVTVNAFVTKQLYFSMGSIKVHKHWSIDFQYKIPQMIQNITLSFYHVHKCSVIF